ncbi:MAG: Sec-independent protein translocase subunit TatA [Nocardiopsaceae bacterium]|nr:Sec-independent protein translocase subunit TatA [Nocardiopsaceae bacterium]
MFDSPWKILIVAVVIIVLFGSRKLPDAARSLGRSMRILKKEVSSMHDDEEEPGSAGTASAQSAPARLEAAPATPDAQEQIASLQQQLDSLKKSGAEASGEAPAEAEQTR